MLDVQEHERSADDVADVPGAEADVAQRLEVVLSSEFPRSPMPLRLWVFYSVVSVLPFGFLNGTVIV